MHPEAATSRPDRDRASYGPFQGAQSEQGEEYVAAENREQQDDRHETNDLQLFLTQIECDSMGELCL